MKPPTIVVICDACDATGVIGKGPVVVVCARCQGNGYFEMSYQPFLGRRKRVDVVRVRRSGQWGLPGEKIKFASITYKDFLKGKRP